MASVPNAGSTPPPPPVWGGGQTAGAAVGYGGFWIRFVAYIIDAVVLSIAGGALGFVLGIGIAVSRAGDARTAEILGYIIGIVLGWLYFALMESSARGATLGKMAMGLRVVTNDGQRLSFMNATGRYFAKFISAILLLVGFIMIGFTDRKRGLHDMMASTLVIKVR